MKYAEAKNAAEYLRNVLENWEHFKEANGGLCKAINDLLKENEQLKQQLNNQK